MIQDMSRQDATSLMMPTAAGVGSGITTLMHDGLTTGGAIRASQPHHQQANLFGVTAGSSTSATASTSIQKQLPTFNNQSNSISNAPA